MHHGKENKYSFKKDGVTYRIQSIVEAGKVEKAIAKTFLMSGKEFLKDMKEGERIGYAIMVKPKEEKPSSPTPIPTAVQSLLYQFKDIIYDGEPPTLPPKRARSYPIDFIPGASLLKKVAYKMTLEQNKEIARQV